MCPTTAGFPRGEFVCMNREKNNLIGWQQTLATSPPNHICFLLVHAKKITKWKTGFIISLCLTPVDFTCKGTVLAPNQLIKLSGNALC
jgi:hypothetical protein